MLTKFFKRVTKLYQNLFSNLYLKSKSLLYYPNNFRTTKNNLRATKSHFLTIKCLNMKLSIKTKTK